VETYLPDNGPHGFYFRRPEIPEWKESTRRAVEFFRRRFTTEADATGKASDARNPTKYQYSSMEWVDPDRTEPEGFRYRTFRSKTINDEVSYLVYLPPDYDRRETIRYPVMYELHASRGTPARDARGTLARLAPAIRDGRIPPMIIVFPKGLRGATMYSDTKDGKYPVETVIVKDLIPHIDATSRTIASREARALDGFSMGGFGAAHFCFRFLAVFGVVPIEAPPLLGPDLNQPLPSRTWSNKLLTAMGGDLEYFRANDPFALIPKNAEALRDRSIIRIVTHVEDDNWLGPQVREAAQAHDGAHDPSSVLLRVER
jgi:endo-1,4-beta-xylanase